MFAAIRRASSLSRLSLGVEKHAPEQKVVRGTFSWTGGTGKYAGIRGDGTFVDYSGEFLPLAEGTSSATALSRAATELRPSSEVHD